MPNEKVAFEFPVIAPGPNMEWIGRVQLEFRFGLENYVSVKKEKRLNSQSTLMTDAKAAMGKIKEEIKTAQKDKSIFPKGMSRPDYEKKFSEIAPAIRHKHADPVVQGFEVSYKATRTDKEEVFTRIKQVAANIGVSGNVLLVPHKGDDNTWSLVLSDGSQFVIIAKLWFGTQRFIATNEPGIFRHRTKPDRDYVQDRHGFFIQRYLNRNMSEFDKAHINETPALRAKAMRDPTESSLIDDITTHVRSKEASGGQTCFISFTHTKHKIVGSTGKEFYNPENGDVIVDAAKVPRERRVDLHSLDAVKKLFGVTEVKPTMPFAEGNDEYEQNAAARDTVRTREILVANQVAPEAVVAVRQKATDGWKTLNGASATLPKGVPDAWR